MKDQFSFDFKIKKNAVDKKINNRSKLNKINYDSGVVIETNVFTKKVNNRKNDLYSSIINRARHLFEN